MTCALGLTTVDCLSAKSSARGPSDLLISAEADVGRLANGEAL
jgi:hypothetical protein